MTAGVFGCYGISLILKKGKVGYTESIAGVLSGGIGVSVVAGFLDNIGASVAIGALTGIVAGFWLSIVTPKLNHHIVVDSTGAIGWLLLPAFLAGSVIAPITVASF